MGRGVEVLACGEAILSMLECIQRRGRDDRVLTSVDRKLGDEVWSLGKSVQGVTMI